MTKPISRGASLVDSADAEPEVASRELYIDGTLGEACPQCEGPAIDEITHGQCQMCGHLWCLECGSALAPDQQYCACWVEPAAD